MELRDLKYLFAYVAPLAAFAGIYLGGIWSFGAVYVAFVLIPLLEFFLPGTTYNLEGLRMERKERSRFFDYLLYLNLPILLGLLWYYFSTMTHPGLTGFERVAMTANVGVIVGSIGINVGHELGHRSTWYERLMSRVFLLTALYMHFVIEHNRGHHKNVATPEDPATARLGEPIYLFWVRSIVGEYINAWKLEADRLRKAGRSFWSPYNEMIVFHVVQAGYLLLVGVLFGWYLVDNAVLIALTGVLLLETVNYIEHYGLVRAKLPSGRYENVSKRHSWNSNHELGRIFLYELTRHSDHHYKAARKYQVLRHFDESPQLPMGYPAAMLTALVPPLWFHLIDPLVATTNNAALRMESQP